FCCGGFFFFCCVWGGFGCVWVGCFGGGCVGRWGWRGCFWGCGCFGVWCRLGLGCLRVGCRGV
ncbi:hypothetical protein RA272_28805, partial [Pseudomonas syringae pv. tagetis]|uniref:hypothetical protein n=1 Tax=Pseudomonas syringae group genomosp. 7 TaxID=251699 RepID=UPI00376FE299